MRTTLIQMGDICGVRLPDGVVEQAHLGMELDLEIVDGALIIRPAHVIRAGWDKAAEECHQAGEDCFNDWETTVGEHWGCDSR